MFTSSRKSKIRQFHVVVVQNGKEMYKKVRCTCKVVVLPTKSIVVFDVVLWFYFKTSPVHVKHYSIKIDLDIHTKMVKWIERIISKTDIIRTCFWRRKLASYFVRIEKEAFRERLVQRYLLWWCKTRRKQESLCPRLTWNKIDGRNQSENASITRSSWCSFFEHENRGFCKHISAHIRWSAESLRLTVSWKSKGCKPGL